MLNENDYGTRDERGHWVPDEKPSINPFFIWPISVQKIIIWLKGYFWPWNVLFALLGLFSFVAITPYKLFFMEFNLMVWGVLYIKNALIVTAIYGFLEWRLYITKTQQSRFKYNAKFPGGRISEKFLFQSQYKENIFWTFVSGISIWSAYEYLILLCWSNDIGLWQNFSENFYVLGLLMLCVPLIHECHFYLIHRILHFPFLYRHIHSVHHKAVNPSPSSSLSMHPVEHLLYWSDCLIHLILPSNPLIALYHLQLTGTGAVVGHVGFDQIEIGTKNGLRTHAFAHYLHHKYFNVNFGDGAVPFDKLFSTWHDGSKQSETEFKKRMGHKNAG